MSPAEYICRMEVALLLQVVTVIAMICCMIQILMGLLPLLMRYITGILAMILMLYDMDIDGHDTHAMSGFIAMMLMDTVIDGLIVK